MSIARGLGRRGHPGQRGQQARCRQAAEEQASSERIAHLADPPPCSAGRTGDPGPCIAARSRGRDRSRVSARGRAGLGAVLGGTRRRSLRGDGRGAEAEPPVARSSPALRRDAAPGPPGARRPDVDVYIAGGVFLVAYALIATERVRSDPGRPPRRPARRRPRRPDQEEAFAAIDLNVIFLLAGMMVLAGGLNKTGFFEFVAGHAIHRSRGEPFRLLILLTALTAGALRAARQRDDRRPADAGHPVDRPHAPGLAVPVPGQPDPRLEHRRDRHPDRRPAEHPDRLGGRPRASATSWSTSRRSCW